MATYSIVSPAYFCTKSSSWGEITLPNSTGTYVRPEGSGDLYKYHTIMAIKASPGTQEKITQIKLSCTLYNKSGGSATSLVGYLYDDLTVAKSSYDTHPEGGIKATSSAVSPGTTTLCSLTWSVSITSEKTYYIWLCTSNPDNSYYPELVFNSSSKYGASGSAELISYNLRLGPRGGNWNGSTSDQVLPMAYGSTKNIPPPTKVGYQFAGWVWSAYGKMSNSYFSNSIFTSPSGLPEVYNLLDNGTVVHEYVKDGESSSYNNDYIIIKKNAGNSSPGLGGFKCPITAQYNKTYYHTFFAKLPTGYSFSIHHNPVSDNPTFEWLTSNTGTGTWRTYSYRLTTSSTGTLKTFGYIAVRLNSNYESTSGTVSWTLGANQITISPTEDQTFTVGAGDTWMYPTWIPNRYTISFNSNGGSGTMSNLSCAYDSQLTLSKNTFTRVGYKFSGWATSASGQVKYTDSQQVLNLTTTNNDTVTLYAVWAPNKLTVIYNANGGTQSDLTYRLPYTTSANYDSNYNGSNGLFDFKTFGLTKSGYKATYWNTKEDGSGFSIDQTTSYTAQALAREAGQDLSKGNVTINLYPLWEPNGLAYIANNSGDFEPYMIYIYNATDSKWEQYIPYIYTNGKWTLFS